MEQIGNTLRELSYSVEQKMSTQYVTKDVHDIALNRDKAHHVNMTCTYDVIPKREYGLLLRKMESWGITAPKAIVKKYGVFIVKRAVEYTDATPNVRNKAGYMTYMCGQFRKDAANHVPQEVTEKNSATTEENSATENPKPQSNLRGVKSKKGIFTPPNIINWQQAREFLCKLTDTDLEDEQVLEFTRKLKKKFNFA